MESILSTVKGVVSSIRDTIISDESTAETEPCPDCMSIFRSSDAAQRLARPPTNNLVYGKLRTEYCSSPPSANDRIEHTRKVRRLKATNAAGCPLCNHLLSLVSRTSIEADARVSESMGSSLSKFQEKNDDDDVVFYFSRLGFFDSVIEVSVAELSHVLVEMTSPNRQFLWFHAFTESVDVASEYISGRPIPQDFESPATFNVLRNRLKSSIKTKDSVPHLPRRVIELLDDISGEPQLRLKVNDSDPNLRPPGRYAALSYCWGTTEPYTTTKMNERDHMMEIKLKNLPKTVAEAVLCTQKLGLRYLWVDALCILQGCEDDAKAEIPQMADIYGNSYVTIQAASAASCNDGLYRGCGTQHSSIPLDFMCPDSRFGSISLRLLRGVIPRYTMSNKNPIDYRGWTYQESLLAPRLLVYSGSQLFLKTSVDSEFESFGSPLNWREYTMQCGLTDVSYANEILYGTHNEGDDDSPSAALDRAEIYKCWKIIVSDYSQRSISKPKDKLLALSAIALRFKTALDDDYLAGCWRKDLIRDLAWVVQHHVVPSKKPKEYRAPSWSWASIDGAISHADSRPRLDRIGWRFERDSDIDVIECAVTSKSTDPFGEVSGGKLVIRGHMMQIPKMANYVYCSTLHFLTQIQGSSLLAIDEHVTKTGLRADVPIVLGKIFWDADYGVLNKIEDAFTWTETRWCLLLGRMTQENVVLERDQKACGLVLSKGEDGTFRRVGWFLGEGMDNTVEYFDFFDILTYFQKCAMDTVTIV